MKKILRAFLFTALAALCLCSFAAAEEYNGLTWQEESGETVTIIGVTDSTVTELTVPAEIDGKPVTAIGYYAFQNCAALQRVSLPESITSVGNGAFCGCSALTEVTLPPWLISLPSSLFEGCTALTEILIPRNVEEIGDSAFKGCTSLRAVYVPKSVGSIGWGAFQNTSALEAVYYAGTAEVWSAVTV